MSTAPDLFQGITQRLQRLFPPDVRARGNRYHDSGAVEFTRATERRLEALVFGSDVYEVQLDWDPDGMLSANCTCPYYGEGQRPCKHLWAALRAAENGAHSRSSRRPAQARPESPGHWSLRLPRLLRPAANQSAAPPGHEVSYVVEALDPRPAQSISLELLQRELKRNGQWGAYRPLRLPANGHDPLPPGLDPRVAALLVGSRPGEDWGYAVFGSSRYRLDGQLARLGLPVLCATGQCRLRRSPEGELEPLSWEDAPWQLWLEVAPDDDEYVVRASLRRGSEIQPLREAVLLLADGVVVMGAAAAPLEHQGRFAWLEDLWQHGELRLPRAQAADLLQALHLGAQQLHADLPEELRLEAAPGHPVPRLKVGHPRGPWAERLPAELSFDYSGVPVPRAAPGASIVHLEARRLTLRDLSAESAAYDRLRGLGFRRIAGGLELLPRRLPAAVTTLLSEGWQVEAEGRAYRTPSRSTLEVASGIDWFDVRGVVHFDERAVPLADVLAALRRGEKTVSLGDGGLGLLPEEWLQRYGLLASLGEQAQGGFRFRRSQAGLLDALLATQPEVRVDATFEKLQQALRSLSGVAAVQEPQGFHGQLRDYQRLGLGWMGFLERFGFGGCLADDMGLGKTVQVLALLQSRRAAAPGPGRLPSLVVAPRSLVFNWKDEALRFTPELRVLEHTGNGRSRKAADFGQADVVLTTYGTLRRDALLFKEARFDYAVLDEAQAIKNAGTDSAKAARLIRAEHRLALSGTPVENHVGELWSLLEFLNPGMAGRASVFGRRARELGDEQRELLARALRPFVLRRTKEQVASELPPKVEQTLFCELEGEQRRLYEDLRLHYQRTLLERVGRQGLGRSKIMVLEALLRLRQAACHPGLLDPRRRGQPGAKLETLLARLEELREEGHKALVFSQFTSYLAILRERLAERGWEHEYLDGRTRDRAARVKRFQEDPGCGLFLVSLKAGGLGLNLTAATYVFLLDPWWNPAVEAQAVDRTHRIGQARHVFAYRLIARGTVEEKVLELQSRKRGLAEALLGGDKGLLADLKPEDLELLLS